MPCGGDVAPDALVVELEQALVVEQIDPPHTGLEQPDPLDELVVAGDELVTRLPVPEHERVANEHLTRQPAIDAIEADHPVADDRQSEQRDGFGDHRPPRPGIPPRLAVRAFDQVLRQRLGPLGLDCDHPTRPQLVRLDQLGRHHPSRRAARQHRAGGDHEPGVTGTPELAPFAVAHADLRQQSGQHGAMHVIGVTGLDRRPDLQLAGDLSQLAVQVAPLAHTQVVEVLVVTHAAKLIARELALAVAQVVPQGDRRQQIRTFDVESAVQLGGPFGGLLGSFTDILDRQRRGDHQDLPHTTLTFGLDHHPAEPWVDREPRQLTADVGQLAGRPDRARLERPQLVEQEVTVADRGRVGRLDERETVDIAETDRRHLQDHRSETGAQDLWFGELGSGVEIVLGVEPDADTRRHAAASPGALIGRCLRHGLDR